MALPVAFDKIKAKEALLRPLPVDKIMAEVSNIMGRNGITNEPENLFGMFELVKELGYKIKQLEWFDWRYQFSVIHNWGGSEYLLMELTAEKMNTKLRLSVNKKIIFGSEDGFDPEDGTVLDIIGEFFYKAQENIFQWNEVCSRGIPRITKKPPIENKIKKVFSEFVEDFTYEFEHYYNMGYFEDFAHYEIEKSVWPYEFFNEEVMFELSDYEVFGPYRLYFDTWVLGSDHTYGFTLIECYIETKGIGVEFFVGELEINNSEDKEFDEWEQEILTFKNDLMDAVVQWNKIVGR